MNAKDVIRQTIDGSDRIVERYLADLGDADLLVTPVEGMNHIAWQVGHLIASERGMVEAIRPGSCPPLPPGFAEAHDREAERTADPSRYKTKAEYLDLWKAQRSASLAALEATTDEQLDAPAPERFRGMWPTVGSVFNLVGTHALMHVGQFVAVRRWLKKPIAI